LLYWVCLYPIQFQLNLNVGVSTSVAVFGDFYFNNKRSKRAFIGLGAGTFAGGSTKVDVGGAIIEEGGGFALGVVPRVGYEIRFIRLTFEYNFALPKKVPNYAALKLGFNFGGRYIDS